MAFGALNHTTQIKKPIGTADISKRPNDAREEQLLLLMAGLKIVAIKSTKYNLLTCICWIPKQGEIKRKKLCWTWSKSKFLNYSFEDMTFSFTKEIA